MKHFILHYDLSNIKSYPYLYKVLKKFEAKRITRSVWTFSAPYDSEKLTNYFQNVINHEGKIVIHELKAA